MLHRELGGIMFPSEVYLPQSTAFPERDLKGISPRSIFQISAQHVAHKQSSSVGEFTIKRVFNH
jgi:chromosome partitioning protein